MNEEKQNSLELSMGNLYDMNKAILNEKTILKEHEIKDCLREITIHYTKYDYTYFMLLCSEKYDFTLFNHINSQALSFTSLSKDLYECLTNRGEILSIELQDTNAYEIWLRDKEDSLIYAYYFFPYDEGVIEL